MDNPRAIFEEIKNDPSIVKIILTQKSDFSQACIEGESVKVIPKESLAGAYYLAISKIILTGYSLQGLSSYSKYLTNKHKIVQLWHGIPLKRIGKLFPGESIWDNETHLYSATICSSEKDQEMMQKAFSPIDKENVWLTGLPRNDLILKDEDKLPSDYKAWLDKIRRKTGGRKMVLYAPTWRETKDGAFSFSNKQLSVLGDLLEQHNTVFAIRGHANESEFSHSGCDESKQSIIYVNDIPDVSMVLRETDILITDYSSIYIDFLITGNPILHFVYDMDSYLKERGLLYQFERAVGGEYFKSFDELIIQLELLLKASTGAHDNLNQALLLFHSHSGSPAKVITSKIKSLCV